MGWDEKIGKEGKEGKIRVEPASPSQTLIQILKFVINIEIPFNTPETVLVRTHGSPVGVRDHLKVLLLEGGKPY